MECLMSGMGSGQPTACRPATAQVGMQQPSTGTLRQLSCSCTAQNWQAQGLVGEGSMRLKPKLRSSLPTCHRHWQCSSTPAAGRC